MFAATCSSVVVSDVGVLDGTYALDSSVTYPYYLRTGGATNYELYQWTYNGAWYIADASTDDGMRVSHVF